MPYVVLILFPRLRVSEKSGLANKLIEPSLLPSFDAHLAVLSSLSPFSPSMSNPFLPLEDDVSEKTSHSHHPSTSPSISRSKAKKKPSSSFLRRSSKTAKPVLVIHGGAGTLDRAKVSPNSLLELIAGSGMLMRLAFGRR